MTVARGKSTAGHRQGSSRYCHSRMHTGATRTPRPALWLYADMMMNRCVVEPVELLVFGYFCMCEPKACRPISRPRGQRHRWTGVNTA